MSKKTKWNVYQDNAHASYDAIRAAQRRSKLWVGTGTHKNLAGYIKQNFICLKRPNGDYSVYSHPKFVAYRN